MTHTASFLMRGAQVEREFTALRNAAYSVLQQETSLSEIVQLVGKDSLSEDQKMLLEVAKIIREDFLQQNAFSEYDFTCPLYKSIGMLRCILAFYNRGMKAITESQVRPQRGACAPGRCDVRPPPA